MRVIKEMLIMKTDDKFERLEKVNESERENRKALKNCEKQCAGK